MPNLLTFISVIDYLATFNSVRTSLRVWGTQCMRILCPIQWSYNPCSCAAMPVASSKLKPSPLDWQPLQMKHSTGFSTITCVMPSILELNVPVMIRLFHAYDGRTGDLVPLPSNGITCTPKSKVKWSLVFCRPGGLRWRGWLPQRSIILGIRARGSLICTLFRPCSLQSTLAGLVGGARRTSFTSWCTPKQSAFSTNNSKKELLNLTHRWLHSVLTEFSPLTTVIMKVCCWPCGSMSLWTKCQCLRSRQTVTPQLLLTGLL